MHTGSLFRLVINPDKVRGVVNDLPGVGTPRPANAVSVEIQKPVRRKRTPSQLRAGSSRQPPRERGWGERPESDFWPPTSDLLKRFGAAAAEGAGSTWQ